MDNNFLFFDDYSIDPLIERLKKSRKKTWEEDCVYICVNFILFVFFFFLFYFEVIFPYFFSLF